MRRYLVIAAVLIAACSSAHASGTLSFRCSGDSLNVSVGLGGSDDGRPNLAANVRAQILGSCDAPVLINPEPIPLPVAPDWTTTEFTVPTIDSNRYLLLSLRGIDAQGIEFPIFSAGDGINFDMAACSADAIFGRGRIVSSWDGQYWLSPCEGQCWFEIQLNLDNVPAGWDEYVNSNQIVNVYGEAFVDGMPGGTQLSTSRVEPELDPAGCEAIAISDLSWGAIKSMFR